jgi:hypothetical protein
MALVTAIADQNYGDTETIVAALAKEHGLAEYVRRVMAEPER